ncbi:M23 family metallopeptidase [Myxococcus sp. MISCRS1]|uniref:M23 family metallopeptidase n=1 Tax=Myxococcus TaxID=32 RepID=UPI0011413269|nr:MULTISPECIES: M23 family metallopeptidase [unclassified Myxococcus]MBZ4394983.1 M23 family metallopeptidase [Myxococcus sp. AS-1-15]MCK8497446.1 M23 family metallopeptidase [Myxococcus fulvus]MCY1001962.1 M23 family metallopeptidase [Myxococcus sp. MISCRS1]BDT36471.1 M23 family metallopeptidase [Myxococcus sp. MH1]
MAKKSFTLMVIPDHDAPVKRYTIQRSFLMQVGMGLMLVVGLGAGASIHYFQVAADASENRILRDENLTLRSQLKSVRERIEHIGSTLDRVERFDQKLRAMTLLSDPQRNLAMGPTEPEARVPTTDTQFTQLTTTETPKLLMGRLDKLSAEATRQEQSLQELQAYFQDQKSLLASTPSVWPARGWVTSDFGQRVDPYTADRVMHSGLDIAAPHGKEVYAPSDGTVVFAGLEGGYGNVIVVDHGYGIKTRYGHLAKMLVKAGDRVKRGALIAAVGNTGRSTGPHLHYEVRVNGIPQNPRKFILEE